MESLKEITWEEFRESGMNWFVNRILHLFGIAIVYDYDKSGKIKGVYPAKCKYRGFPEGSEGRGFKNLTNYLASNIDEIKKDV